MNVADWIEPSFACRLISTLAHFLWQGSLIALLAAFGDRLLSGAAANQRYQLHVTAMTLMIVMVAITFARTDPSNAIPFASIQDATREWEAADAGLQYDASVASETAAAGSALIGAGQSDPLNDLERASAEPSPQPALVRAQPTTERLTWRSLAPWTSWLALLYFACAGLLLGRLVLGACQAQRLRYRSTPVADASILSPFQRQCHKLGLRAQPVLAWSAEVSIPIVTGAIRPIVLLPSAAMTGLLPDQLQALLTHELAHIRRYDLLVNVLQRLIEAVLFFHPAVWYVSRRIGTERELACDELVLATGCDHTRYADALVRMAELSSNLRAVLSAAPATSLAASGASSSEFKRRVLKVLANSPASELPPSRFAMLVGLASLVIGVTLAWSHSSFHSLSAAPRQAANSVNVAIPPAANSLAVNAKEEGPKQGEPNQTAQELPFVEAIQEFTVDNLPVADVSHIRDPDQLLDQLQKGPRVSHFLMTGGGIVVQPDMPPPAWQVELWNQRFADNKQLDPRVRQLIALGDVARKKVQERILAAPPQVQSHLAVVLRSIGTTDSIPVLFQTLRKVGKSGPPGIPPSSAMSNTALTSALWELTGRKHHFTAAEWEQWWNGVKADFVVARERQRPAVKAAVTKSRVQALVNELAQQEVLARERLIALGQPAVPHLLDSLQEELQRTPIDGPVEPGANRALSLRLAWALDELGATQDLPAAVRQAYFTQRFSAGGYHASINLIDEDALSRALCHCSFADFCLIFLAADGNAATQPPGKWPTEIYAAYCRRFSKLAPPHLGGWTENPHWKKVTPAENPADEIAGAIPILVDALKDQRATRRNSAAKLAAAIGFCSTTKPEPLIVALRDAWLSEPEEKIRPEIAFAMCRFATPLVVKEVARGMLSDRPEIVSDCAGLIDWIPIQLNDETRPAFERLVELTRHQNDKLRSKAVRSLRGKAVKLLEPELPRLTQDAVAEIREECARALPENPTLEAVDLLFKLADDVNEQVRLEAIQAIGNSEHLESMVRMVPLLRDKKIHGYAVAALATLGGKDALPLMLAELKNGNDIGGMVYQHLRRLSGQTFEDKPEPWLDWWKRERGDDAGQGQLRIDVPNGVRLELVGISTVHSKLGEKDQRQWWDARGSAVGLTENLFNEKQRLLARPEYANGHEAAIRLSAHSVTPFVRELQARSAWIEGKVDGRRFNPSVFQPDQTPPLLFLLNPNGLRDADHPIDLQIHTYFMPKPGKATTTFRFAFGHETTSRTYDDRGQLAHETHVAPYPEIWRRMGLLRIETRNNGVVVSTKPTSELGEYGFANVQVLLLDGHMLNSISPQRAEGEHEEQHVFEKVNREDIEGVTLSVRPVTHWVSFTDLPLQSEENSGARVEVRTVDHGRPG